MDVNLQKWAAKDSTVKDWQLPIKLIPRAASRKEAGTTIVVREFPEVIQHAFKDETLPTRLYRQVGQTYAFFLERYARVTINGEVVSARPIPLGYSKDISYAIETVKSDDVQVKIVAGFAAKGEKGRWESETAGWYILCNGRIVVAADKTELTGWGAGILPAYQPKFRGFVGVVMFESDDPLKLPWTTTKRGLNRDALAYQRIRHVMSAVARPITTTLEKFYSPEKDQAEEEKAATESIQQANISELSKLSKSSFSVKSKPTPKKKKFEKLSISVTPVELKLVRNHLGNPKMAKAEVGRQIFDYFMESEGLK